ncbi:polymeric immunoglobulin receptor-like [Pangasianodon hypophthalmus]|uniref:polymeric immunoglobulin receptor-like n=1 Tax=Pangasianodon hypophthalmus TaxID=310915 RepID=UPI0023073013|nr:polymeric immunoglobulin receptor-like [Pangasianodon hypophthalmus]
MMLVLDLVEESLWAICEGNSEEWAECHLNLSSSALCTSCALSADNDTEITRHKGGSVLLPCSCSDLHTKPQKFTWMSYRTGDGTEVLNDERYRGRLQLFNNISPANLSLLISDLREEDQGVYRCSTEKEHRDIWLSVKGCELVKKAEVERVSVFTGESVVLPCVCTDLQAKPQSLKWEFNGRNRYQEIYPEQTGHHRNRVKLVRNSPGNLSLLISDLTEEDKGRYRCSVQADRRYFRLYVKGGRCGENVITDGHQDCEGKQEDQFSHETLSVLRLVPAMPVQQPISNASPSTSPFIILTSSLDR